MLCTSFKDLFCTAGITKPHEIITYFFLSLCLFLSVCFHAVKGIWLEPTSILFKWPYKKWLPLFLWASSNFRIKTDMIYHHEIEMSEILEFPTVRWQINGVTLGRNQWYFSHNYSCVHISSDEVFSKILKKPSIVQKKLYLIWKPFNKMKQILFLFLKKKIKTAA